MTKQQELERVYMDRLESVKDVSYALEFAKKHDLSIDINRKDSDGKTALNQAAWMNMHGADYMRMILEYENVDINMMDNNARTPLINACRSSSGSEKVALLLSNGAKLDEKDIDGFTALHYAVAWENIEKVKLLVEKGANVNSKNNEGQTPLDIAKQEGYQKIVSFLQEQS